MSAIIVNAFHSSPNFLRNRSGTIQDTQLLHSFPHSYTSSCHGYFLLAFLAATLALLICFFHPKQRLHPDNIRISKWREDFVLPTF